MFPTSPTLFLEPVKFSNFSRCPRCGLPHPKVTGYMTVKFRVTTECACQHGTFVSVPLRRDLVHGYSSTHSGPRGPFNCGVEFRFQPHPLCFGFYANGTRFVICTDEDQRINLCNKNFHKIEAGGNSSGASNRL